MKVYEFLNSISDLKPQYRSGRRGLNNKINSVEFISSVNSTEWLKLGALVFTSSFHLNKDEREQLNLIQKLIKHRVSGLVLTSGMHQPIYKTVLDYADFYNLPIIEIAENISYDKLFSPLYQRRFKSKDYSQKKINENKYDFFFLKNYTQIENALDDLSEILESSVYIEDEEGRLIYASEGEINDGWRKIGDLFSSPSYENYKSTINMWNETFKSVFYTDFIYTNQRRRVVLPLNNSIHIFAYVHLTYKTNEKRQELTVQQLTRIKDKLYLVVMREFVDLQHKRINDDIYLKQRELKDNEIAYLIHFDLPTRFIEFKQMDKLDYYSVIEKYLKAYLKDYNSFQKVVLYERDDAFFALIILEDLLDKSILENRLIETRYQTRIRINRLILSIPFADLTELTRKQADLLTVKYITTDYYQDQFVCYYDDIGLYNYLLILKNKTDVSQYVLEVIRPLLNQKNTELLETLETYINERGNVTQVGKKLYLQRRTVTYRLKKITELLNVDLNNSEDLFLLQFSLKIYKLNNL